MRKAVLEVFEGKTIDKTVPVPMYYQLKKIIQEEIVEGALSVDDMIPTEKEISEMFQLSRTTVRQAILELTQEGYLYRVKSKGTFVSRPKDTQSFIQRLESFDAHIKRLNQVPRTEILSCKVMPMPTNVATILRCEAGAKAIQLIRLRFADNEPVVITETYLPYQYCAYLLEESYDMRHLYVSLSSRASTRICKVLQSVEAVPADARDVEYMKLHKGAPIQLLNIVGFNRDDVPLELTYGRFRGDRHKFQCQLLVEEK